MQDNKTEAPYNLRFICEIFNSNKIPQNAFDVVCEGARLQMQMELIYCVQKISRPSALFVTSSISMRTTYFSLDDIPTLTHTSSKQWACLTQIYYCKQLYSKMKRQKYVEFTIVTWSLTYYF